MRLSQFRIALLLPCLLFFQCTSNKSENTPVALLGATLIDGTGTKIIKDGTLLISGDRIEQIGTKDGVQVPANAVRINLDGKFIMPGFINSHGHIGGTSGLTPGYSPDNVVHDLEVSARYGITTVFSLGGDQEFSSEIRQLRDSLYPDISRLFIAGEVVTGNTPEEARASVDRNASLKVDIIKIRVDDNLGTTEKMTPEIYEAVIDQANKHNLKVAAHIFYLEDAKALLRSGVHIIAHSVRDQLVDDEFINLMKEKGAFYCPTLMREVSAFVYGETPDFFEDPFFLLETDSSVINQLKDPVRQQKVQNSESAKAYKKALDIAKQNLKILANSGVQIVMGTDTGPPGRFQGYFEHLELSMMKDCGLTPEQVIRAATLMPALCYGNTDVGDLKQGSMADFIVLESSPLEDVRNTRGIVEVWIGGKKIKK